MMISTVLRHDAVTRGGAAPMSTMELGPGAVRCLSPDGETVTLLGLAGDVWITQTAGGHDVILRRGERFISRGRGCMVIEAITGEARIGILETASSARHHAGIIERLGGRLRALFTGRGGRHRESYCN